MFLQCDAVAQPFSLCFSVRVSWFPPHPSMAGVARMFHFSLSGCSFPA